MLAKKQEKFWKSKALEGGLSDFHKKGGSVFKLSFKKQKPKIKNVLITKNSEKVLYPILI